jgi:hypothetical protein
LIHVPLIMQIHNRSDMNKIGGKAALVIPTAFPADYYSAETIRQEWITMDDLFAYHAFYAL